MQFKKQSELTPLLKAHSYTVTVLALLLLSSCAVQIHDAQFCSPLPGGCGAVCDNFLTSNQRTLSGQEWQDLQVSWQAQGQAVECTTSATLGDIKAEIEQLCSMTACDYATQQAITSGLEKIQTLGNSGMGG